MYLWKALEVEYINFKDERVEVYDKEYNEYHLYAFKDVKFMENTGFKDRNGKYIYVGDIVEISDKYFEVTHMPFKGFVLKRENYIDSIYLSLEINADKTSVVGNIYENKDLLEG
jgi:phage protein